MAQANTGAAASSGEVGAFAGGLCDAPTGTSDGQQLLERLERDNLFLTPLDVQREWYRYHHLFAESAARSPCATAS